MGQVKFNLYRIFGYCGDHPIQVCLKDEETIRHHKNSQSDKIRPGSSTRKLRSSNSPVFGNFEMKIKNFNLIQKIIVDLHQHADNNQQQSSGKEHLDEREAS